MVELNCLVVVINVRHVSQIVGMEGCMMAIRSKQHIIL